MEDPLVLPAIVEGTESKTGSSFDSESKAGAEGKLLIKVHYLGWRDVWDEEVCKTPKRLVTFVWERRFRCACRC